MHEVGGSPREAQVFARPPSARMCLFIAILDEKLSYCLPRALADFSRLFSLLLVLRGTIVNRTCRIHKKNYIFNHFHQQHLVLLTMVPRNSVHHLARPSLIVPYPIPGIYTTADRYLRTLTFYSSYEYLLLIRTWAGFFSPVISGTWYIFAH